MGEIERGQACHVKIIHIPRLSLSKQLREFPDMGSFLGALQVGGGNAAAIYSPQWGAFSFFRPPFVLACPRDPLQGCMNRICRYRHPLLSVLKTYHVYMAS